MQNSQETYSLNGSDIRCLWDEDLQMWLFSAVDAAAIFSSTKNPRRYWSDLKRAGKLDTLRTKPARRTKLACKDGCMRETDMLDAEQLYEFVRYAAPENSKYLLEWMESIPPHANISRAEEDVEITMDISSFLPLTSAAFEPGHALEYALSIADTNARNIAIAEYHYYRDETQQAISLAEPYLDSKNPYLRLSASWICGYANLSKGDSDRVRFAIHQAHRTLDEFSDLSDDTAFVAAATLVARGMSTCLHLPDPEGFPPLEEVMAELPEGARLLAAYVNAHRRYLEGHYPEAVGIAEGALCFSSVLYPCPAIYLRMACVMGTIVQHKQECARSHMFRAWEIAKPDGMVRSFAEHHGLLGGMVEQRFKVSDPGQLSRLIEAVYNFAYGWRLIHNPAVDHEVADNLSTTEFTCAMLASRGWTNQEIAEQIGLTDHSVKRLLSTVYAKLGIDGRKELTRYMLV